MGLKAKEYLGSEVLVGEEGNSFYGSRFGNSFCCSVEVWFSVDQDSTILWIFSDNDNCNVNGNGNDNGNGGEAL